MAGAGAFYLPDLSTGYLPLFVLIVGITAIINAFSCYRDIGNLQRIYNPPNTATSNPQVHSPVTRLQARTFATWNIAVGLVRCVAAYNMEHRACYVLSLLTNVVGLMHFVPEVLIYRTARPFGPVLAPFLTAMAGVIWHLMVWQSYVQPNIINVSN